MNSDQYPGLDAFVKLVEANLLGYGHSYFSYFSLRKGDLFELIQGHLVLVAAPDQNSLGFVQSESSRIGSFRLAEAKTNPSQFIRELMSGKVKTPHGDLHFPREDQRPYYLSTNTHYLENTSTQRRSSRLYLGGSKRPYFDTNFLDWELKSLETPYFNLQEALGIFGVGDLKGDSHSVEVIAFNLAAIATTSTISNGVAKISVVLADGLNVEDSSVGYRIQQKNRVIERGRIPGASLSWEKRDHLQFGSCIFPVPDDSAVDCIANFGGIAQSHYWIINPAYASNPLRIVHGIFDNNLKTLRELVGGATEGSKARDLEIAVSWLFWMLGFSVTPIGGHKKTSDAPDLIAVAPSGDMLIVECTTGILKEDSKLSHLIQRTEKIKQTLAASENRHIKIVPIIVTTKTKEEVKADIDYAYKNRVFVATIDMFEEVLGRTFVFPNANSIFSNLEKAIKQNLEVPDLTRR